MALGLVGLVALVLMWPPEDSVTAENDVSSAPMSGVPARVMDISTEIQQRAFRSRFLPVFWFVYPSASVLTVAAIAILDHALVDDLPFIGIPIFVIGLIPGAIGAFAACRMFKFQVYPTGVKGYPALGFKPRTMTWDEMEVLGPIRIWSVRYLRIRSVSSGEVIWLPLFLHPKQAFRECIEAWAPEGHEVRRFLRGNCR